MKTKNPAIIETLRIFVGMCICLGLMLGVYALLNKFSIPVLAGGIVGTLVGVGNFFFMAIGLMNLTEDATEGKVRLRTQSSLLIRSAAIFAILIVAIRFCGCDALATLLPMLFTRPVLMAEQFILNSKTKQVKEENDES